MLNASLAYYAQEEAKKEKFKHEIVDMNPTKSKYLLKSDKKIIAL